MNDPLSELPEGYFLYPSDNSFNDAFAPLYITMDEALGPRFALKVEKHHLNPMGICHGAVYMSLFDMAFPAVIGHAMGKYTGTPTMNININFVALSREGEWLYTEAQCTKLARTAAFTQGVLRNAEGEIKATASGVFKTPKDWDTARDFRKGHYDNPPV